MMEGLPPIGEVGIYGTMVFALVWVIRENTRVLVELKHAVDEWIAHCKECRWDRKGR